MTAPNMEGDELADADAVFEIWTRDETFPRSTVRSRVLNTCNRDVCISTLDIVRQNKPVHEATGIDVKGINMPVAGGHATAAVLHLYSRDEQCWYSRQGCHQEQWQPITTGCGAQAGDSVFAGLNIEFSSAVRTCEVLHHGTLPTRVESNTWRGRLHDGELHWPRGGQPDTMTMRVNMQREMLRSRRCERRSTTSSTCFQQSTTSWKRLTTFQNC